MSNQFAVQNYRTFQCNQVFFRVLLESSTATKGRLDKRNLLGMSGDVFGGKAAPKDSTTSAPMCFLRGRHLVSTVIGSVFRTAVKLVTQERERED